MYQKGFFQFCHYPWYAWSSKIYKIVLNIRLFNHLSPRSVFSQNFFMKPFWNLWEKFHGLNLETFQKNFLLSGFFVRKILNFLRMRNDKVILHPPALPRHQTSPHHQQLQYNTINFWSFKLISMKWSSNIIGHKNREFFVDKEFLHGVHPLCLTPRKQTSRFWELFP